MLKYTRYVSKNERAFRLLILKTVNVKRWTFNDEVFKENLKWELMGLQSLKRKYWFCILSYKKIIKLVINVYVLGVKIFMGEFSQ